MSDRTALIRECAVASAGILAVLGLVKHLAFIPLFAEHGFTIAAAAQLWIPVWLIGRRGITGPSIGLPQDGEGWPASLRVVFKDTGLALALGVATIAPFAVGHHIWQTTLWGRTFALAAPEALAMSALTQVVAVALPEELFFRGYLQGRLELLWPAKRRLFGVPFGGAIVAASAVFALAHFVGEYNPVRLGPFFPALLFGLLRTRTGRITAPVVYHAFCNLLSETLAASYSLRP